MADIPGDIETPAPENINNEEDIVGDEFLEGLKGYLIALIVSGSFGNLLVLVSIISNKSLHNPLNVYLANLACTDLFISIALNPASIPFYTETPGEKQCEALGFITLLCILVTIASLALVSSNLYIRVCQRQYYLKIYTRRNVYLSILFLWLIVFTVLTPPLFGLGRYGYNDYLGSCLFKNDKRTNYFAFVAIQMIIIVPTFGWTLFSFFAVFKHFNVIHENAEYFQHHDLISLGGVDDAHSTLEGSVADMPGGTVISVGDKPGTSGLPSKHKPTSKPGQEGSDSTGTHSTEGTNPSELGEAESTITAVYQNPPTKSADAIKNLNKSRNNNKDRNLTANNDKSWKKSNKNDCNNAKGKTRKNPGKILKLSNMNENNSLPTNDSKDGEKPGEKHGKKELHKPNIAKSSSLPAATLQQLTAPIETGTKGEDMRKVKKWSLVGPIPENELPHGARKGEDGPKHETQTDAPFNLEAEDSIGSVQGLNAMYSLESIELIGLDDEEVLEVMQMPFHLSLEQKQRALAAIEEKELKETEHFTKNLFVLWLTFMIFWMPAIMAYDLIYVAFVPKYIMHFFFVFGQTSSSVQFIIHALMSPKFREAYKRTLTCGKYGELEGHLL